LLGFAMVTRVARRQLPSVGRSARLAENELPEEVVEAEVAVCPAGSNLTRT